MRGGDLDVRTSAFPLSRFVGILTVPFLFSQTASYVLGLECLTSLIAGRLFREDLSPTKESWFDAVESFSPAGRVLVNIGQ